MVTYEHEVPLRLLRDHPASAPALAKRLFDLELPEYVTVRSGSEALTNTNPPELTCDNVEVCYDSEGEISCTLIIEVQRKRKPDRPPTWFTYLAQMWKRTNRPTFIIVFCPDRATAGWARTVTGPGHPGTTFVPLVLGPDEIPIVTERLEGDDSLLLTFLSGLVHGEGPHAEHIANTFDRELGDLPREQAIEYAKCALTIFPKAVRMTMEALMRTEKFDYHRELLGDSADVFLAQGVEKGIEKGKAEGAASLLLSLIKARGFDLTEAQRQLIAECTDEDQLTRWAENVLKAESVHDIFA
ncbi:hypothetical protein [Natronoglycomyces albus]|uniref:DUF4351 domain-containing protein n=1 Tax=Natronoglycomyces albus TaxID=2811108 RepID=A0A895XPQ4_9ACTN|nr:hypothetical protein [Natronoglycomyces albus]QSB05085.1 hypothetical protein JQS30_15200 [Natronoglycomyces albus]